MRVVLGNRKAVHQIRVHRRDGAGLVVDDNGDPIVDEVMVAMPRGKRALDIQPEDGDSLADVFRNITHPQGIWASHAAEGAVPAWVASDSPGMASLLSEHFGGIEIRDLDDPYEGRFAAAGPMLALAVTMLYALWLLAKCTPFLKVNAGNDFQAAQMGGSASATAVAKWVALTANATAPAAGDTTLTAEIATGGGGLIRKAGTYAHTTGAASYTITTTFTANGSDSLPVTIAKRGIFDAASSGNLVFETAVSPTATLSASGDALTLTDTISL